MKVLDRWRFPLLTSLLSPIPRATASCVKRTKSPAKSQIFWNGFQRHSSLLPVAIPVIPFGKVKAGGVRAVSENTRSLLNAVSLGLQKNAGSPQWFDAIQTDVSDDRHGGALAPELPLLTTSLPNGLQLAAVDFGGLVSRGALIIELPNKQRNCWQSALLCTAMEAMAFQNDISPELIEENGFEVSFRYEENQFIFSLEGLRDVFPSRGVPFILSNLRQHVPIARCEDALKEALQLSISDLAQSSNLIGVISEVLQHVAYPDSQKNCSLLTSRLLDKAGVTNVEDLQRLLDDALEGAQAILVGVNVTLEELCSVASASYASDIGALWGTAGPSTPAAPFPQKYCGGVVNLPGPPLLVPRGATEAMVAFDAVDGGWLGKHFVDYAVLRAILGEGGTFSTGGPGKGIFSRLYRNVLSIPGINTSHALNMQSKSHGLFGVHISGEGSTAKDLANLAMKQLEGLRKLQPSEVERAKQQVLAGVRRNMFDKGVISEDVGQQLLLFKDKCTDPAGLRQAIRRVELRDLERLVTRMLKGSPSIVCVE